MSSLKGGPSLVFGSIGKCHALSSTVTITIQGWMFVTASKPVLTCSKTEWLTALGLASYGLGFPSVVISVGEPDEAPCGLLGAPFARTIKTAETRHERPSRLAPKHIDYNQTSRNIKFFLLLVPPLQRNGRIPSLEQRQGQKLLCSHPIMPIMLFNPKYIYFHL